MPEGSLDLTSKKENNLILSFGLVTLWPWWLLGILNFIWKKKIVFFFNTPNHFLSQDVVYSLWYLNDVIYKKLVG